MLDAAAAVEAEAAEADQGSQAPDVLALDPAALLEVQVGELTDKGQHLDAGKSPASEALRHCDAVGLFHCVPENLNAA